jgi:hypothetical protein
VCDVTNAALMMIWGLNYEDNCRCVDWTCHGKTCVRNHIFHIYGGFLNYCISWWTWQCFTEIFHRWMILTLKYFVCAPCKILLCKLPQNWRKRFDQNEKQFKNWNNVRAYIIMDAHQNCILKFNSLHSVTRSSRLIMFREKWLSLEPSEPQQCILSASIR